MRLFLGFLVLLGALLAVPAGAQGTTGFYVEPVTPPGSIFDAVDVEVAADGRIFVLMKGGRLRVVRPDGTLLPEPWIDLGGEVFNAAERGLLGFALHPDFPATPDVYFVYTVDDAPVPRPTSFARGYGRVTRYSADPGDPNRADPASRRVLLGETYHDGIPSCYLHHSIGTIAVGHDGSLFVGSGDGSGAPITPDTGGQYDECFSENPTEGVHPDQDFGAFRALSLESLSGKILRIDPATGGGYPDNPFYTGDPADIASKVWALGLRNPFRFSVAPLEAGETGPGTLYIGDVGQSNWEELNRSRGGENFGWPCYEGPQPFGPGQDVTGPLACSEPRAGVLTTPYAYWHHDDPALSLPAGSTAYSVTGGVVYTGTAYPAAYQGALFFADYAQQWVRSARLGEDALEGVAFIGEGFGNIVDLAVEPATGELIGADVIANHIVRIRYAGGAGSPPVARLSASRQTGVAGDVFAFDATASLDPDGGDLTYAWTFGDGATGQGETAEHAYGAPGLYTVTVVVTDPDGQESRASRSIRIGTAAPVVVVVRPTEYVIPINGRVRVEAMATDSVDTAETFAFEWAVDLVHNDHVHERFFYTDEAVGEFVLDPHGGGGETTHYRATVTVTDGEGLVTTASQTLRTADPREIDVASAAPLVRTADGAEVAFARPIRVARVGVPRAGTRVDDLAVELRRGGEWYPVRFPSVLPEGDSLQVVFVEEAAEAVRVVGADTLSVHARLALGADLPGGGEGADVGAPAAPGRASVDGTGALVVVGGGALRDGAYHHVRQVMAGDGSVTARVDALSAAAPTAGAGVVLRDGAPGGMSVAVLAEPDGDLALWTSDGVRFTRTRVGDWSGPVWLRLRRVGPRVTAERSDDGQTWAALTTRLVALATDVWAGPAATAGDRQGVGAVAVGWLSNVSVDGGAGYPPAPTDGPLSVQGVYPNPSQTSAVLVLDAVRAGTYRVDLTDVLGRVVWTGYPASAAEFTDAVSVTEARPLALRLDVAGLGSGTYIARVHHVESGDVVTAPITVVR